MERNNLYPIFLKTEVLEILIVGGGWVAEEKLRFLTKSSPNAKISMVAPFFREDTLALAKTFKANVLNRSFKESDLEQKHMVIATTNKPNVNIEVYNLCRANHILVNVADNPPLCDFYMGGIVTKGNVKVAISTNGKSPTTAKRLRQFFEAVLPEEIDDLVQNLQLYRKTLEGDFENKVSALNTLTKSLVSENKD